jgi:hypothetical protein
MLQDVSCCSPDAPPRYKSALLRRLRTFTLTAAKPAINRVNHPTCHAAELVGWRLAEGEVSISEIDATLATLRAVWEEGFEGINQHFEAPLELLALPRLVNVLTLLLTRSDKYLNEPAGAARQLIVAMSLTHPGRSVPLLTLEETQSCCWLLREIFGNRGVVFGPPIWEQRWVTSTTLNLATGIYDEKAFHSLPILADALQDAGCDSEDILNHFRQPGEHCRGCWALDLVLDKK